MLQRKSPHCRKVPAGSHMPIVSAGAKRVKYSRGPHIKVTCDVRQCKSQCIQYYRPSGLPKSANASQVCPVWHQHCAPVPWQPIDRSIYGQHRFETAAFGLIHGEFLEQQ